MNDIETVIHLLEEARGFAAVSPAGRENIVEAIEILEEMANKTTQKPFEVYGPYTPTWLGPCVWAGIKEELPPQLVDREVWISTSNPNEVKS